MDSSRALSGYAGGPDHAGDAAGLPHASDGHHGHHATPQERLTRLLETERGDMAALIVYTIMAGLLALAVPLAAQALVNIIAANVLSQPLIVLSFLVFIGLLFAGAVQLMKLALVERLQQRVFARTALKMAQHLLRLRTSAIEGEYAPELVNRFFDVLTVQKALSKLLIDGMMAILQAVVGLALLAIYSPFLLGLDILILLFVAFVVFVLGIGGLRTSIAESKEKYRVAGWLEDLARCHRTLKVHGSPRYLLDRADNAVVSYLISRASHFRVNYRQAAGNYLFQAFANTAVLAVGGWLVLNGRLTLGQLVASQIIVGSLLAALEKLIRQSDQVFDLLTGLDKIGHVLDLPTERTGGRELPLLPEGGARVVCRNVGFSYHPERPGSEVLKGLSLTMQPGERVSLVGASGAGKSTFAGLLCGLEEPTHGLIEINGVEVRDLDLSSLRRAVALVGYELEIFDGTIEENIRCGREEITHTDLRWALEMAQMTEDLARFPEGIKTRVVSGGQNLSRGQIQRLLIARALAGKPALLLLDEAFTGIDERTTGKILDALFAPENRWTILDISHDPEVVLRADTIHVLSEGRIQEAGSGLELARNEGGPLCLLFPQLTTRLRREAHYTEIKDRTEETER
jgi:ABC-type bacteriocin/lantibiotic exporter with double-glycine peptidase domain